MYTSSLSSRALSLPQNHACPLGPIPTVVMSITLQTTSCFMYTAIDAPVAAAAPAPAPAAAVVVVAAAAAAGFH